MDYVVQCFGVQVSFYFYCYFRFMSSDLILGSVCLNAAILAIIINVMNEQWQCLTKFLFSLSLQFGWLYDGKEKYQWRNNSTDFCIMEKAMQENFESKQILNPSLDTAVM